MPRTSSRRKDFTNPPGLSHWLAASAKRNPDGLALTVPDCINLSYRDLALAVAAQSAELLAAGLRGGDRVGIAASRSADTIIAILAAVDAGIGYVPLDLAYPAERLVAMLEDAQPRAVLGEPQALTQLEALVGDLPRLTSPAAVQPAPHAAENDLTYVLFTSGSTGRPKGVAMGSRPLRSLIEWHAKHPRLGQPARTLLFAPLSFDVHFQEIFSTLACGGTLILIPEEQRRDPGLLLRALIEHRVERVFVPYVALQMIADASRDNTPAALRDVISAGEQLQVTPAIRSLFMRLPGAELHNHYGPTESHVVTAHELRGDPASWPEIPPIGLPLPHVRIVLHNRSEESADGNETGELLLGGDTLADGYLGRPDLTAERFRSDIDSLSGRWYVTGDLVRLDSQGVCTYLGRADQQLKVDGFRIEPGEIELAMMAHDGVKDAVVTAPDLPGIGKQLVAYLVLRDPAATDPGQLISELRAHLRGSMPEYMVPVRFVTLDRLPTTPSGKIDRRGLPLPSVESKVSAADNPLEVTRTLWQELLGLPRIDDNQNLFDLGARSLLVMRFAARLKDLGIQGVSVADIYDRPTVAGIADAMGKSAPNRKKVRSAQAIQPTAGIAIVGMATRTPGAANVDVFWQNLLDGKEGIRHFALGEIDPSIPESIRSRPNFVPAHGVLEDVERFDAVYFGISAREATMLDPQQRLMLELSVSALEHAAIDPSRSEARIGVYAGTGNNAYAPALRQEQPDLVHQYGEFATMLASEKDYVATRIAHRLNLNGPAVSIHTACSTSLVAVAQAWHALASGQCDIALAGGTNVVVPQINGYLHVEGGMESADGHCRPFDAEASGTVFASGGGVVVLRRLEDALASGDTIYGVIRGVGINNDGGDKASFTAPSVSGQASAIRMALDYARVDARQIGYVEAHGTGTSLGDPIEVAAITRAWREDTADNQFCGIGSVKSNLGHMAAGAGVIGLIKATLSLHYGIIPGTLHYRRPNPQIDFANTPFKVIAHNTPWPRTEQARLAAVSSFGVGGTNAHVIIEEASRPPQHPSASQEPRLWVLPLSARSQEAALRRARDLADHLAGHPELSLADVAATLMRGRKPMAQRLSVVASSVQEAVDALRAARSSVAALQKPRIVFLFPGQGSQHPGMARRLYDEAPAFREALDRSLDIANQALGVDLRQWLVTAEAGDTALAQTLAETRYAQPALFSVSYALAAWLDSLGLRPDAMIGHSIGEYAAACHAGVFSLEDAMTAVIARGQAMFDRPRGAMLAVRTDAEKVRALLSAGIEIAGCNAPALTVVAGSIEAIDSFAKQLETQEIDATRLRVSHAFHSASMDDALPLVEQSLARAKLRAPEAIVYSCVSGAPLQADEATDPHYWARQVRAPVMFSRAVGAELARGDTVFIEVGPGQALTALLRQHRTPEGSVPRNIPILGPAQDPGDPARQAISALGALWCAGVELAWPVAATAHRIPLPTYPFEGQRHWFTRGALEGTTVTQAPSSIPVLPAATPPAESFAIMSRIPTIENELKRVLSDVSGLSADEMLAEATFVDLGLDSLSLTQSTLELERVFGIKLRFRRLMEDLDNIAKLAQFLDAEMPADKFRPAAPTPAPAAAPTTAAMPSVAPAALMPSYSAPQMPLSAPTLLPGDQSAVHVLIQQQMQLMAQQLALLSGQPAAAIPITQPPFATAAVAAPAAALVATPPATSPSASDPAQPSIKSLIEKPFGASPRLTLDAKQDFTPAQHQWLDEFIGRYNARSGKSKAFSQQHRKVMADPRVATGFNPLWKDLVYPIVVDRSKGANLWDMDGNEYIDLLSCFGGNLLGYQPQDVIDAMANQLKLGLEVGPQHPIAAEVATLISEFTGMERVAFCNTGSEAVMGAMRIARTVTGRKTIAIFTNSYHGIFDEVIVRGTKQLRSLSAAPGILANAVENILVLDWNSENSLRVLRERGPELAAIMTEPIQNKYPTIQPRGFVQSLRKIADQAGCALIFDEVVTGFRVAPGGAQEFYGVRADIATYGKVIGGGLPFAAIAGNSKWLDALDGGHWQYGDNSYPEAGVTYFAGTFVRHPLALAAARAALLHIKKGGRELYRILNGRTQALVDRLNSAFAARGAPVKAVHCASLWRLQWDDNLKYVSLFYYLARFHGLHLYEQFGHFVTEAMGDTELDRIFAVFTSALDELMALGFIPPQDRTPPPTGQKEHDRSITTMQVTLAPAGPAPLTPGQTERWLAASFDQNARKALNESLMLELSGTVDRAALEAALIDVMQRHEAFRIVFDTTEPLQTLAAEGRPTIHQVDLSGQPDANAALDKFCDDASRIDFALDKAPLGQVSIVRLPGSRTVVHLVVSHLIFDGWASPVFLHELALAYRARCLGTLPQWPAVESPRSFAVAELARWDGEPGRESSEYWKREMQSPPAPLSLGDLPPPSPRCFDGDSLRARIDGPLLQALAQLARQNKATMFQLLLAGVTETIHRMTGRDDFVISIPYASQSLARHGPLLADGVLDLPLRLRRQTSATFPNVLAHVKGKLMDALEHPLATQGSVARSVGIVSQGSRPPLTGVFFNLNPRLDMSGFEPLRAQVRECRKLGLLSEVIFNFYENPNELTLDLHHSTEYFSKHRAAEVVEALLVVLRDVAGMPLAPQRPAGVPDVPESRQPAPVDNNGLSAADVERLARWNSTDVAFETGLRLGDLITRTVAAQPNAIAIRFEGRSVSYAEMDRMAWVLANELRNAGVKPGDLVGVCLDRSVELVVALVAVTYSGGAYVPLDPAYPPERLTHMCEDAQMPVLVTRGAELVRVGHAIPGAIHKVMVDDLASRSAGAVTQGVLTGTSNDPAYVIFTSGSTGRPKGAMNAHKGIVNRLQWMQQEYQLTSLDRVMQKTPYSFDVSVWEFFWPLMTGATIVVARPDGHRDAGYLAQLIQDEAVTLLHFVPSMLRLFLEEPRGEQCRSVRQVVCSGEALPIDAVDRFFEVLTHSKLGNLYGPTEAAVDVTCWNCKPGDPRRIVPIGWPIANTKMYVLSDKLELLPPGAEGELYIGGIQVGMGYVSRPDLTGERFLPDPFIPGGRMYKTGDIGRWLDDGVIEYMGRADHQVKIRGFRIELGEIEAQLMSSPAVNRSVVVARDYGGGDLRLVAYVVPRGMMPEAADLKAHLSKTLPEFMVPQVYVAMGDIPLLPNGKIDRKALPVPPMPKVSVSAADQSPQGEVQTTLATIIAALLKVPAIGAHDDFFALGGHSLLAARAIAQVNKQLGTQLTLRSIFEAPTVAKLAAHIDAQNCDTSGLAKRQPIAHRADQTHAPITVMQERIRFIEEMQPGRVVYNAPSAHRLKGRMDVVAFDRAFSEMLQRQPALRTSIVPDGSGYVQRIDPVAYSLLPLEDLSDLAVGERESELAKRLEALTAETFQLDAGPLFKARLFKLAEDEHALFFMTHHIIWDGWSFDVLYAEISSLYADFLVGRSPSLAPPPVTFGDYCEWHTHWVDSEELRQQIAYWKKQFSQAEMPKAPLGDFPRQLAGNGRGATAWMHLDGPRVERIRELARQTGSTLSIVMLSVYAAMMSQWLGDRCPAIGMPVRGRTQPELEGVMGFFNNMLPLRLPVDTEATARDWIRRVREAMVGAFASQDAPFEMLARELEPAGNQGPSRLYQVMFSFQDARARQTHWGPLEHERIPLLQKGATEDVNLWMVEINSGIEAGFQYNSDLFLPTTIDRLRDRFLLVLDELTRDPTRTVGELLAPHPAELTQLNQWSLLPADANANVDALDKIAARRSATPTDIALRFGAIRITYADLWQRTLSAESYFRSLLSGLHPIVAIAVSDPITQLVASLGALRLGARILPVSPDLDDDTLMALLKANEVNAIVCDNPLSSDVQWLDVQRVAGAVPTPVPLEKQRNAACYVDATPEVLIDRASLSQTLAALADLLDLAQLNRTLCMDGPTRGLQLIEAVIALTRGCELVILPRSATNDVPLLSTQLNTDGVCLFHTCGANWKQLLAANSGHSLSVFSLIDATDTTPDLVGALVDAGATVISIHRPTIHAIPVSVAKLSSAKDSSLIGRPLQPGILSIRDAEGTLLAPGVPGRLSLSVGPSLPVDTGLVARWRGDGMLQYIRCIEPTSFIEGNRLNTATLEQHLLRLPSIVDAGILTVADPLRHRCLVVLIQPRSMDTFDPIQCTEHIRQALPIDMPPPTVIPVDRVLRLADGSPDPGQLSRRRERSTSRSTQESTSHAEALLIDLWEELLGINDIGPQDNFFDLGGNSLLAMQVIVTMETKTAKRLSPRRLVFENLRQLALAYDDATKATPPAPLSNAPKMGALRRVFFEILGGRA